MNDTVLQLPESPHDILDRSPDVKKVQVTLLDCDNLPVARGSATVPLLLGVGVFWPCCPMPCGDQLATAACFLLPGGELMKLQALTLCPGDPPRYEFRVSSL